MSDDEDDLFGSDSDDTNELISNTVTSKKKAPAPRKKGTPSKKDVDSDDEGGLFDSDSEDEEDKKPKASAALSRRQRLEALAKRQRKDTSSGAKKKPSGTIALGDEDKGYDSGDSYDSGEFQRTREDDDFLDTTGEDADAVKELYAEQHFDDDRPDNYEQKKKKRKIRYDEDGRPRGEDLREEEKEPDNPIMAAVHRMKKKKVAKKTETEREDECKLFLARMEAAADDDEQAVAEKRPAVKKLAMLQETTDMLTKLDMQRMLLDLELLSVCRRWIQPLPNGKLGNVTVRQRILEVLATMTGENGISANDLKRSEFGKTVMVLYKHHAETPKMKQLLKKLIEQWSRPIFQKSGNMRDLERIHRGEGSLATVRRQQQQTQQPASAKKAQSEQDMASLIAGGKKTGGELAMQRVRVPYSKGFSFSVRPQGREAITSPEQQPRDGSRGNLAKRMIEKKRPVGKNQRSANISLEGRPTKG
ncbi:hypothetical protein FisN_13Lh335 [Fistulifera solaris]|uniref:TFIIS N-terminal domain-containing protein n=1 Tax=Fistulifera solaris TaxID=1519565 RepID=A0A1Z5KLF9_FISSO|nr:hypothetical protein FisN_13Lh335 [Fistulifera solaris]|eukprot:GAX27119.1 hypothetical protein FisN_13Lh335 [Fistulifera solaris]